MKKTALNELARINAKAEHGIIDSAVKKAIAIAASEKKHSVTVTEWFGTTPAGLAVHNGNCAQLAWVGTRLLNALGMPATFAAGSFTVCGLVDLSTDDGSPNAFGFDHRSSFGGEYHAWIMAGRHIVDFALGQVVATAKESANQGLMQWNRNDLGAYFWGNAKAAKNKGLTYQPDPAFSRRLLTVVTEEADMLDHAAAIATAMVKGEEVK